MLGRRRIVPDTSIVAAGYGLEARGAARHLMPRSQGVLLAIRSREVRAFAPELLATEMLKLLHDEGFGREHAPRITRDQADALANDFLRLPIVYTSSPPNSPRDTLGAIAWSLMRYAGIAPPDSWFVACAIYHDAELWISHVHADHLLENARAAGCSVHALNEKAFAER